MHCAREMGMRVLTVHSKIYINCTIDGRLSSQLHNSLLLFHNILFLLLFPLLHTALLSLYKRKMSRSIAGVAYIFFLGAVYFSQIRATSLFVSIRLRISWMKMHAELYSGLMSTA